MANIPVSILSKALTPIVGGLGKELGGLIGDQVRFFRWKNAIRILERAKEYANERGVPPSNVPLKFLVPFLEGASLEEGPNTSRLIDMWAMLLVSAIARFDSNQNLYIDVLRKLSSRDARGLQALYDRFSQDNIFCDEGFDPDSWNLGDIDQVRTDLNFFVSKFCLEALTYFTKDGLSMAFSLGQRLERRLSRAIKHLSSRVDIVPVGYSIKFYYADECLNGCSGLLRVKEMQPDSIQACIHLKLFERFEASTSLHDPDDQSKVVRMNMSFICLSSTGFGLMRACCRKPNGTSAPRLSDLQKGKAPRNA
jgi:hypothetical protein